MRPLKFRIWDGNNKHFVYPDILELDRGLEYQQFTGLFDKQGKEIYEGDVVKLMPYSNCEPSTGIVYWNNEESGFQIEAIKIGKVYPDNAPPFWNRFYNYDGREFVWEDLEVIGNKWENPELLEERK